jgi:membrane protein YqaA with SNARE-associated domain
MALQFLESQRQSHPELAEWYTALADLYQQKLWHQLTLKLEQFVTLAVVQVGLLGSQFCWTAGFYPFFSFLSFIIICFLSQIQKASYFPFLALDYGLNLRLSEIF